ncbi:glycosyltransferase [Phaeobacter porticola]|uniref:Rhamnosyl transferase n=1 Tax=Phaeobacter porticola TaxID=1844006 RepID=A0A1L3I2E9_9RHOB|nr:glycosyltransferase [Phaeobacter porticola]APG46207.1 Putative rhamnosyl transferase [Phaeobacter porticola]
MQVFGYIRFSYLGRSDARLSRVPGATQAEYFQRLFDPLRMETRFHFFEKICLPSIKAQSDQEFTILVMASQDMPQPYKTRLAAAVADIPQIRLCYSDVPNILHAFRPIVKELTEGMVENSIHFRMDDDDAIGAGLIGDLRRMAQHAEPGTLLSLPRGFHLFAHQGRPYLLPKIEAFIAIGFAFVNAPDNIRNPYASAHQKAFHRVPSMMEPRPHSYIHVAHSAADTRDMHAKRVARLLKNVPDYDTAAFQDQLRADFAAAFPHSSLEEVFSTIQSVPDAISQ